MLWTIDSSRPEGLGEQIAAQIRRGVVDGQLVDGERLPTAAELARVLAVNANTVLAAYRRLRDEGLLEFRRGRGVTVRAGEVDRSAVLDAARQLVELGRTRGFSAEQLAALVREQ